MRIQRIIRASHVFVNQVAVALLRAVVTTVLIGAFAVFFMHYMGVPVPNAHDLLNGLSRLANVLS